jgi:HSP20 family protein
MNAVPHVCRKLAVWLLYNYQVYLQHCRQRLEIIQLSLNSMGSSSEKRRDEQEKKPMVPSRQFDNMFDTFRREMERMMARPWSFPKDWDVPSLFEARDMRMAPYELVDKGDRFELQLEVPGIEKENISVKATKYSVEISGKHSEKDEEKGKRYVYSERLYRSFYRNVPLPEEIIPSKVSAKVVNGILRLDLRKKNPTESESEATRVEVE